MSAARTVAMIKAGDATAEEVVSRAMSRIRETVDMNIYITINENALQQARRIDKKIKSGADPGRLAGIPVSIKDNICTKDFPTTCASKMLESYVPPYDATVIRRLHREGAIIVGKTNMDEFAMGLTTEFSAFGPTLNPRDPLYVPGGSSGGSAASVAAGTALLSLGSDTGGSVRNPASFCGICGLKPTYGMVSRYGLISYANSIEQIGPMGSTIPDIRLMLDVISGRDPNDDTTLLYPGVHDDRPTTKRVGLVEQMAPPTLHPGIRRVLDGAVSRMVQAGYAVDTVSLDMVKYSVPAYYTITSTEAASNLARYDNIRYGYDADWQGYEFHRYVTRCRGGFGPEVKRRIIAGGFVPSAGYAGRYFLKALRVRDRLVRDMDNLFKRYDYLISPTVPVLPFKLGERIDDPVSLFEVDANTVTANLSGKPAVSVPLGECGGLPVGIQLMADSGRDAHLLAAARILEGGAP